MSTPAAVSVWMGITVSGVRGGGGADVRLDPLSANRLAQGVGKLCEPMVAYRRQGPRLQSLAAGEGAGCFLIGPEGGWSEEEREALLNHPSVIPITLGPRILRVETACLTCLAALTIFTPPL